MSARRARADRRGFTLVEVLAGLALSLTAIGLLASVIGIVSGAWNRRSVTAEAGDSIGRAVSRFTDDIESVVPWRYVDGDKGMILFGGQRDSVVFAGIVQTGAYGTPRLRLVSYRIVVADRGFNVERRVAAMPANPRQLSGAWRETVTLLAGVERPRFAFADPTTAGTVWRGLWPAGPALPSAVRLSFALAGREVVADAPVYADPERDCLLPARDLGCAGQQGAPAQSAEPSAGTTTQKEQP